MSESNLDNNQFSWLNTIVADSPNIIDEADRDNNDHHTLDVNTTLFKRIVTTIKHNNRIVDFCAYKDLVFLALSHGVLNIYDVKQIDNIVMIESIDLQLESNIIHRIFVDPDCKQIVICLKTKKNILVNISTQNYHYIPHLNGCLITSLIWFKNINSNSNHNRYDTVLFGTDRGLIYESIVIGIVNKTYSTKNPFESIIDEKQPLIQLFKIDDTEFLEVKSLHLTRLSLSKNLFHLLVSTPKRMYQFLGNINENKHSSNEPLFIPLFEHFNLKPSLVEFPSTTNTGNLQIAYNTKKWPSQFLWQSGSRLMYGYFSIDINNMVANIINTHILPLPKDCNDKIVSIVLTTYHCMILYPLRLIVFSLINMSIIIDETLGTYYGQSIGITKDVVTQKCWYFTDHRVFFCNTENEDENIWKSYMAEGMFVEARKHCKDNPANLRIVIKYEADWFFKNKDHLQAAKLYAQELGNFEEASLKFLSLENIEPLSIYLNELLSRLGSDDSTQMALILNWLIRINLNYLIENNASDDFEQIRSHVYSYVDNLFSNKNYMNCIKMYSTLFYQIFEQYTDHNLFVKLANKLNDHGRIITHFIDIGDFESAINILKDYKNVEMIYKYSNSIIRYYPKEMVDIWIEMRNHLDPRKLLDAIKYFNSSKCSHIIQEIVRYIEFCVESLNCMDRMVHNHLITLYCCLKDYDSLLSYITTHSQSNQETCYDIQFALRLCNSHNQQKCCIYILSNMNLYNEAVELALNINEIDLAKKIASKPEDDDLKKKLWLIIAEKTLVGNKDIGMSMNFLKESKLLRIEDILQFFDDFTYIDQFRDAICESLEDYNKEIDSLTKQMNNYTNMSNQLKCFSDNLKKRHIMINLNQNCYSCNDILLTRAFYAFPCSHTFHQDCFIKKYYNCVDDKKRIVLGKSLARLFETTPANNSIAPSTNITEEGYLEELFTKFQNLIINENNPSKNRSTNKNLMNLTLKKNFDNDMTKQCLMCSELTIDLVDLPLLRGKSITDIN